MKNHFLVLTFFGAFLLQGEALPLIEVPKTCLEILRHNSAAKSGVYEIDPDGQGTFKVYCDMATDGGGWTVFQRRQDGSVDFYRSWAEYKAGFGKLRGEHWLGNDHIHRMTAASAHRLRVDLEDFEFNTRYAEYSGFKIDNEAKKYKLSISGYSGNAGDSLLGHNSKKFTTRDQDNDLHSSGNCAAVYHGAWWYSKCHSSNLNGKYLGGHHASYANGVNWYAWRKYHYSLKITQMKIRPSDFSLQLRLKYAVHN